VSYGQLDEWTTHKRSLLACRKLPTVNGVETINPRFEPQNPHEKLIKRVDELVSTLKEIQIGAYFYEVSENDLHEVLQECQTLSDCRRRLIWY